MATVHAQTTSRFEIPAQPLADALRAVGRQTNTNLLFDPPLVVDRQAPALKGELTTDQAISRLLVGTGITHEFLNARTVVLAKAQTPSTVHASEERRTRDGSGSEKEGRRHGTWNRAQWTEADTASGPDAQSSSAAQQTSEDAAGRASSRSEVEEVVVTGSHIRGVQEVAAPVISVTRHDIEKMGYTTLEDLLSTLPQNFAGIRPDGGYTQAASTIALQNRESSSSIDLRGLGPQSTLTLVNGVRRAGNSFGRIVDISAIPLSAIERVEVVSGGRSAVYGSDAVAGVVNIITRREFTGAETQVSLGAPTEHPGYEHVQFSQIVGFDWQRAHVVAAYDFMDHETLDLVRTGVIEPTRSGGVHPSVRKVFPDLKRHSGLLSGRIALSERTRIDVDALYTSKKIQTASRDVYPEAERESSIDTAVSSDFGDLAASLVTSVASGWTLNAAATGSRVQNQEHTRGFFDFGGGAQLSSAIDQDSRSTSTSVSLRMDGPLPALGSVTPSMALGIENLEERFENTGANGLGLDLSRRIRSAFIEVSAPLAADGFGRLDLSLAARYDEYSDAGSTFNPQAGIIWQPIEPLKVRVAYATAFRAPSLFDIGLRNYTYFDSYVDPLAASGFSTVLVQSGGRPDLQPEIAQTWSAGVDIEPTFMPWLTLSLSYFSIDYEDRIESPATSVEETLSFLVNESRYPGLIIRAPTAEQLAAAVAADADGEIVSFTGSPFDPNLPGLLIFDNRTNNIATEKVRGIDLSMHAIRQTEIGSFDFGVNASYTLHHERRLTATSPTVVRINEPGKPVDFRARLSAGWSRGAFGVYAYLNHMDGYDNPFTMPPSTVDSWTTVDLSLRYDGTQTSTSGLLRDLSASLSFDNLLDAGPPLSVNHGSGFRYDSANANPFGRMVALRVTKRWQ